MNDRKRMYLDVLVKHGMGDAEARRFLHDVPNMTQLADKLKRKFTDGADALMAEVCFFSVGCMCFFLYVYAYVPACARVFSRVRVCVDGMCR